MWMAVRFGRKCFLLTLCLATFEDIFCNANAPPPPKSKPKEGREPWSISEIEKEETLLAELYRNYSRTVRPSTPVDVKTHLILTTINKLDTKTQTLSTTGFLATIWDDKRLAWNSSVNGIAELFVSELTTWVPSLIVMNEVNYISVITDTKITINLEPGGKLNWKPPRLMDTSCSLDIVLYPFDTQVCTIKIAPWGLGSKTIRMKAGYVDMSSFTQSGEWELIETRYTDEVVQMETRDMSMVTYTLVLRRRPTYYILNAVVPSILMSFLPPLVFILPTSSGERISYVITVFLAVLVMLTLILEQLPSSSKNPSIFGIFLTVVTFLAALAVPVTVLNLSIHQREDNEVISGTALSIGRILRKIFRKPIQRKIRPSDDADGINENSDKGETEKDALTYRELSDLLDLLFFRLFVTVTAVSAVVSLMLLNF